MKRSILAMLAILVIACVATPNPVQACEYAGTSRCACYQVQYEVQYVAVRRCYDVIFFYDVVTRPIYTYSAPLVAPASYSPGPSPEIPELGYGKVGHYSVRSWSSGTQFVSGHGETWNLVAGQEIPAAERVGKLKGYRTQIDFEDGTTKVWFHQVHWDGKEWQPTGRIFVDP